MSITSWNAFDYFDAIYCINLDRRTDRWEAVQKEFDKVGILDRVVRFSAIETPENGAIWCLLSHRSIIQKAQKMGWKNVLVFEDDVSFMQNTKYIHTFLEAIKKEKYYILYLWGFFNLWNRKSMIKKSKNIVQAKWLFCTFSICYSAEFYDIFLADYPEWTIQWIQDSHVFKKYKSIDDRLMRLQEQYYCVGPKYIICTHTWDDSDIQKYRTSKYKVWSYWKIAQFKPLQVVIYFLYTACKFTLSYLFPIAKINNSRVWNNTLFDKK